MSISPRTGPLHRFAAALIATFALSACATGPDSMSVARNTQTAAPARTQADFTADREAILEMAGDFEVTFDFTETVSFKAGYELKPSYVTGGHEVVRVIEDRGDFISLQHILVVDAGVPMPIKHWRQDWTYQPAQVLTYIGENKWEMRPVPASEAAGKWSQVVYQVDDAPRYGALAAWTHEDDVSAWEAPRAWRPLPRREATKREDYQVMAAINRHAITPDGWVHEQDNSKLIVEGDDTALLAREIGINTYERSDIVANTIAETYWAQTADYWAGVRDGWIALASREPRFGLTVQGEPEEVYMKILNLADEVRDGDITAEDAIAKADAVIDEYTRPVGADGQLIAAQASAGKILAMTQ